MNAMIFSADGWNTSIPTAWESAPVVLLSVRLENEFKMDFRGFQTPNWTEKAGFLAHMEYFLGKYFNMLIRQYVRRSVPIFSF